MKLFEIEDDIVSINLDLKILKGCYKKENNKYGDEYNFLVEKIKMGNREAVNKATSEIKKELIKKGCTSYDDYYKKVAVSKIG